MVRFLKLLLKIFGALIGLALLSGLGYYLYAQAQKAQELKYPSSLEWSWHSYPWQINSDGDRLRAVDLDSRYQIVLGVRARTEEEVRAVLIEEILLRTDQEDYQAQLEAFNNISDPYPSFRDFEKELAELSSEHDPMLVWSFYFEQDCIPNSEITTSLTFADGAGQQLRCSDDGRSLYIGYKRSLDDSESYHNLSFNWGGFSAFERVSKRELSPLLRAAALTNAQPASAE